MLVAALASSFLYGYVPWGGNYRHFTISDHDRRAAAVIAQIPADAKVSAQDRLNPHVSGRETIYIFPRIEDADTVFIDVTGPAWPQHPSDVRATVDRLMQDGFGVARWRRLPAPAPRRAATGVAARVLYRMAAPRPRAGAAAAG